MCREKITESGVEIKTDGPSGPVALVQGGGGGVQIDPQTGILCRYQILPFS